jgi:hypothetical protein
MSCGLAGDPFAPGPGGVRLVWRDRSRDGLPKLSGQQLLRGFQGTVDFDRRAGRGGFTRGRNLRSAKPEQQRQAQRGAERSTDQDADRGRVRMTLSRDFRDEAKGDS